MREIYTARLTRKLLLSQAAQCYHLAFAFVADSAPESLQPGQFLSLLGDDANGKTYTRAYSVASAPSSQESGGRTFDLCVNRVEGGFFSNLLCDLREGDIIRCHGPHGLFTLRPNADSLLIAAGTGIAPMRGFAQWLFPAAVQAGTGRSDRSNHWLVYEASGPEELFYNAYFEELAAIHPNFHYLPVVASESDHVKLANEISRVTSQTDVQRSATPPRPSTSGSPLETAIISPQEFACYAYVCGLSDLVKAARAQLLATGWQKHQILFERYD